MSLTGAEEPTISDRVRELRRRRGLTQEELAEQAALSPAAIRKIEQGGTARMETYNALGRVLGVRTVWFMNPTGAPEPQPTNDRDAILADIRSAVNPPATPFGSLDSDDDGVPPDLASLQRATRAIAAAYQADRYDDVAVMAPSLIRSAQTHVRVLEGDQRTEAIRLRADALQLTGRYLVQVREHDLALIALRDAIRDAVEAGDQALMAAAVGQQGWALLRQARFDEVERLCVAVADNIEPRMSKATSAQLAAWGYVLVRGSTAAARNNRVDEAHDLQRVATSAAARLSNELLTVAHISFGPVTAAMNHIQNELVTGHPDRALSLAEQIPADGGEVTANTRQRYELDLAKAHLQLGNADQATASLISLRRASPNWLRHQQAARDIAEDILAARKRMPTQEQRELADFLAVPV